MNTHACDSLLHSNLALETITYMLCSDQEIMFERFYV